MAEYLPTNLQTAGLCETCPKCCDDSGILPASVCIGPYPYHEKRNDLVDLALKLHVIYCR